MWGESANSVFRRQLGVTQSCLVGGGESCLGLDGNEGAWYGAQDTVGHADDNCIAQRRACTLGIDKERALDLLRADAIAANIDHLPHI